MPWNPNTKKMTAPVGLGDISQAVGLASGDLGTLIKNGVINKWALYKPIRYNKVSGLTRDEFIGMQVDVNEGIYFGLKLAATGQITAETSSWPLMHGVIWEYLRPRGIVTLAGVRREEWFRATDFVDMDTRTLGYSANAAPNPSGRFAGSSETIVGYYDISRGIDGIMVHYNAGNNDGVDLSMILKTPSTTLLHTLARTFPCALVTDANGRSLFTALFHDEDGGGWPRPLYYNNAYTSGAWYLDFYKSVYEGSGHELPVPWSGEQTGMKITLFMLYTEFTLNGEPYLDAGHTQPLGGLWYDCSSGFLTLRPPVPFPDGTNFNLELRAYNTLATRVSEIGIANIQNRFSVRYKFNNNYTGALSVAFDITCEGQTRHEEVAHDGVSNSTYYLLGAYSYSDFGILPISGDTVTISVTATTSIGSAHDQMTETVHILIP